MTTQRRSAKGPPNPYLTAATPDELEPANRIAYDLIHDRRDLLPSVERIMTADLDEAQRLRAMTLFRDSFAEVGDPHRDPRVAIAKSGGAA